MSTNGSDQVPTDFWLVISHGLCEILIQSLVYIFKKDRVLSYNLIKDIYGRGYVVDTEKQSKNAFPFLKELIIHLGWRQV